MNTNPIPSIPNPPGDAPTTQKAAGASDASKRTFTKVTNGRDEPIEGLWVSKNRYYGQLSRSRPGSRKNGCTKRALRDDHNQPVKTIQQAKIAMEELRRKMRNGEVAHSGRAPLLNEYVLHYLSWIAETQAKKPKTITQERSVLNRWAKHFGATRLTQITPRDINLFVLRRKKSGVGNRTVNMDVLVLGNLFRFAKKEGLFPGNLPTKSWEALDYRPEKQQLLTEDEIDCFCATAVSTKEDGTPRFQNGEMLRDAVRFMSLCGARVKSAFAVLWRDVDWEHHQLHIIRETKYSKSMIVDMSPELESLLKGLFARRQPDADAIFPSTRSESPTSVGSLRKTFELVRAAAKLPKFKFHSLRHYFISKCVMSGIDLLTIASWVGHADTLLISRVYGHLSASHKQEAAQNLVFGSRTEPPNASSGTLIDANNLTTADLLRLLQQKIDRVG